MSQKGVDLTAPYSNDGSRTNSSAPAASPATTSSVPNLAGSSISVLKEGETADHRKHGNGKDISDDLAVKAPKRGHDLHPSNTYQGDGDEVDDSEWD
ncbi:hypothetical protein TrCOL_g6776 [Triparma columacea]|uniref:Uncharacterized protein n=1 Tax=Triparma columacea TaxID=722753 RepID=A0A9W7G414_9STRA|nr:hypothetical protein TrCOL_g6776 [Triparma columacea]